MVMKSSIVQVFCENLGTQCVLFFLSPDNIIQVGATRPVFPTHCVWVYRVLFHSFNPRPTIAAGSVQSPEVCVSIDPQTYVLGL